MPYPVHFVTGLIVLVALWCTMVSQMTRRITVFDCLGPAMFFVAAFLVFGGWR